MAPFDELGSAVEERWRRADYLEAAFPDIARDALQSARLVDRVDPWDIVRWAQTAPVLPLQQDVGSDFSDLPLTVYSGSRFYIDAYFWLDGTTSIHQHAFSGAFQVLLGGSLHSEYRFDVERIVSEHFAVGRVAFERAELLGVGDSRRILPDREHIHGLFHLERPSLTITVRNGQTASAGVQFEYLPPALAIDPHYRNAEMIKRVQSVSLLYAVKHSEADALAGDLLCAVDFHTAFRVLSAVWGHLRPSALDRLFGRTDGARRFDALLDRARSIHGSLVDVVRPVLEEDDRQRDLVARRQSIVAPAHRLLLALLLNVLDRASILSVVADRHRGSDPVVLVLDWLDELAGSRVFGSPEENVIGVAGYGVDHRRAIEAVLRGSAAVDTDVPYLQQIAASPLRTLLRG